MPLSSTSGGVIPCVRCSILVRCASAALAVCPATTAPDFHCFWIPYRLDCPAFRVPADLIVKHESLVFAAMDAMQPSRPLLDIISR